MLSSRASRIGSPPAPIVVRLSSNSNQGNIQLPMHSKSRKYSSLYATRSSGPGFRGVKRPQPQLKQQRAKLLLHRQQHRQQHRQRLLHTTEPSKSPEDTSWFAIIGSGPGSRGIEERRLLERQLKQQHTLRLPHNSEHRKSRNYSSLYATTLSGPGFEDVKRPQLQYTLQLPHTSKHSKSHKDSSRRATTGSGPGSRGTEHRLLLELQLKQQDRRRLKLQHKLLLMQQKESRESTGERGSTTTLFSAGISKNQR